MKKKQLVAAGLTAVMGISMLAGCGTGSPNSGNQGDSSSNSELEPVELVWNVLGTPQTDQDAVFEEVNKILKEELNTTVKFNVIDWGSYDEKMQVAIATNDDFDICFTSDWTNPYVSNAQKGAFYPLSDLLDEYGTHIKEQVPESYWEATKIDGEIYGVVNYQISARIRGATFPKDVVDEVGYDVSQIHQWSDMTGYLEAVKEKKPDITPFLGFVNSTEMPALFTEETGYALDSISGPLGVRAEDRTKSINMIESPEFMEFCKLMRDWYEKGYVRKDVASINDEPGEQKTHNYAAMQTGIELSMTEAYAMQNYGYEIVQAQTVPAYLSTGTIQAALTAISANSEHPERAMMVIDYLFENKDLYNLLVYGIEGKHYEKIDETHVRVNQDAGYVPGNAWVYGSWFNAYLLEGQPDDYWDIYREVNENAITSPVLGFVFDPANVKTEMAQITALMDEYMPGLLTGSVDPEEKIPELIEKMNSAGMDKIMEEADAQLAEWK